MPIQEAASTSPKIERHEALSGEVAQDSTFKDKFMIIKLREFSSRSYRNFVWNSRKE